MLRALEFYCWSTSALSNENTQAASSLLLSLSLSISLSFFMGLPSRRCQIQRGTDVKLSRPDWYRRPKSRLRCQSQTSGPSLKTERLDPVTRPKVWTESQDQTFGLSLKTKRSDSGLEVRIFYFDMEVKISISVCLRTDFWSQSPPWSRQHGLGLGMLASNTT